LTWEKRKITIVTKAYPESSIKHGDVACTAGITEEGEWIRLYPIDMRHFIGKDKISKFDIIEVMCKRDRDKLSRKESYKIRSDSIRIIDKGLTVPKPDWKRRNNIVLTKVNESIKELENAYQNDKTSIGLIKPKKIIDLIKTEDLEIFEQDSWSFTVNLDGKLIPKVAKIPHIFKYRFQCKCCVDNDHRMQCEDWELFESYRSWGARYKEPTVLWEKLKEKYLHWMIEKRNMHFIMGMYSLYPTWFIIGIYYPPQ
jgi:hypothetical protein